MGLAEQGRAVVRVSTRFRNAGQGSWWEVAEKGRVVGGSISYDPIGWGYGKPQEV